MFRSHELSTLPIPVAQNDGPPQGEGGNNAGNHGQNPLGGGDNHVTNDDESGYQLSLDDDLRQRIEDAKRDRHILLQDYATSTEKLGIFSTSCLLINRMIGTGIFETPKSIWLGTGSVSASIFMWCAGTLMAFGGLLVYLELGLTIPRYLVRGRWRSVPRSGGEKNYVSRTLRSLSKG